jgi:NDP-sugar pyrophosphorylase family protein
MLRKTAFDDASKSEVFDLAELYQSLLSNGQMAGYEVNSRFYEIGSTQGLAETEEYLLNLSRESGGACP